MGGGMERGGGVVSSMWTSKPIKFVAANLIVRTQTQAEAQGSSRIWPAV